MAASPASAIYPDRTALYGIAEGISPHILDRKRFRTPQEWDDIIEKLKGSKTLYVGNLSFYTTEEQIYELFSRIGPVRRVIMGLNSITKQPCGFCFVEYYTHEDAVFCKKLLSGTKLDDRIIRADIDEGFKEGRQYGRSKLTGGQIRDDFRMDYDPGRGGWSSRYIIEQKATFSALQSLDATPSKSQQQSEQSASLADDQQEDGRSPKRRRLDPDATGALVAAIAAQQKAEADAVAAGALSSSSFSSSSSSANTESTGLEAPESVPSEPPLSTEIGAAPAESSFNPYYAELPPPPDSEAMLLPPPPSSAPYGEGGDIPMDPAADAAAAVGMTTAESSYEAAMLPPASSSSSSSS